MSFTNDRRINVQYERKKNLGNFEHEIISVGLSHVGFEDTREDIAKGLETAELAISMIRTAVEGKIAAIREPQPAIDIDVFAPAEPDWILCQGTGPNIHSGPKLQTNIPVCYQQVDERGQVFKARVTEEILWVYASEDGRDVVKINCGQPQYQNFYLEELLPLMDQDKPLCIHEGDSLTERTTVAVQALKTALGSYLESSEVKDPFEAPQGGKTTKQTGGQSQESPAVENRLAGDCPIAYDTNSDTLVYDGKAPEKCLKCGATEIQYNAFVEAEDQTGYFCLKCGWEEVIPGLDKIKVAQQNRNLPQDPTPTTPIPNAAAISLGPSAFGIEIEIPPAEWLHEPITEVNRDGEGGGQLRAINTALTGAGYKDGLRHSAALAILQAYGPICGQMPPPTISSIKVLSKAQAHVVLSFLEKANDNAREQLSDAVRKEQPVLI